MIGYINSAAAYGDGEPEVWHLDFVKGEARKITVEENARMAMEFQKRCTYKDGVCYVDCEPPE